MIIFWFFKVQIDGSGKIKKNDDGRGRGKAELKFINVSVHPRGISGTRNTHFIVQSFSRKF